MPLFPKSFFVLSSGRCAMLRDADPNYFAGIYIVCDCFFSAADPHRRSKVSFGKEMASCFFTNA